MVDAAFLSKLRRAPILINTARGEIFDTEAVVAAKDAGQAYPLIVDCWENEPRIDRELLRRAAIATPAHSGLLARGQDTRLTDSARRHHDLLHASARHHRRAAASGASRHREHGRNHRKLRPAAPEASPPKATPTASSASATPTLCAQKPPRELRADIANERAAPNVNSTIMKRIFAAAVALCAILGASASNSVNWLETEHNFEHSTKTPGSR